MFDIFCLETGVSRKEWNKLELRRTLDACRESLRECVRRFIKAIDVGNDKKACFYEFLYMKTCEYIDELLLPNAKAPSNVMHDRRLMQCIFDAQKEVTRLFTPEAATVA